MIQNEVRAARTVTPGQIGQTAQSKPDVRRSPLFVWMSENQTEFERLVADGHTWQALAESFTEHGILAKGGLRVTARTARISNTVTGFEIFHIIANGQAHSHEVTPDQSRVVIHLADDRVGLVRA